MARSGRGTSQEADAVVLVRNGSNLDSMVPVGDRK